MANFRVDVKLYGTAYVEADTIDEARKLFAEAFGGEKEHDDVSESAEVYVGINDVEMENGVTLGHAFSAYGITEIEEL